MFISPSRVVVVDILCAPGLATVSTCSKCWAAAATDCPTSQKERQRQSSKRLWQLLYENIGRCWNRPCRPCDAQATFLEQSKEAGRAAEPDGLIENVQASDPP
jgi:hypothetical protein